MDVVGGVDNVSFVCQSQDKTVVRVELH